MKEQNNNKGGKEMIKTKELTIGCHVKVNGEPCKVDEVVSWSVGVEGKESLYYPNDIEPIPITKELLLKNGFVELDKDKYHNYIVYVFDNSIHLYNDESEWKLIIDVEKSLVELANIEYVHQVQTLCNLLGIELKMEV